MTEALTTCYRVAAPVADIRAAPGCDGELLNEALYGELVALAERSELRGREAITGRRGSGVDTTHALHFSDNTPTKSAGKKNADWIFGKLLTDGYKGYFPLQALVKVSPGTKVPTHRVAVLRTYIYEKADIKSPARALISLNSLLRVSGPTSAPCSPCHERFCCLEDGGWVFAAHIRPHIYKAHYEGGTPPAPELPVSFEINDFPDRLVRMAKAFKGTPYLWGGRTSLGLDCSALVQLCLQALGCDFPRDTPEQARVTGPQLSDIAVSPASAAGTRLLQRADLVFWPGHVGILTDAETLIHANAHHMQVVEEPFAEAIARIAKSGDCIERICRFHPGKCHSTQYGQNP